ncbi:uncharacterized protein LOC107362276 [Tetranychus urticae]|uniref:uncharacterized protein LOC107362276 n=1 Tax=Tetranychus urticae TaxID=32264 RepID=UPI0003566B36|nr:uncharacterized protein LOC107362276 [Tetranychus urticae]
MIKPTFTLILLLFALTAVQSASDGELVFKEICNWRTREIKAGTFDEAIKAMNVCREKVLSKDELATVDKCESVVPMTKADQVTKTCADFNGNKDKYSELVECEKKAVGNKIEKFMGCFLAFERDNEGSSAQKGR